MFQVLSESFAEVLGHDTIIGLLNTVADDTNRGSLIELCKGFLAVATSQDVITCRDRFKLYEDAAVFLQTLAVFEKFCKCVLTLFQVKSMASDPDAVQFFASYKGPGLFEKAVNSILTREVDMVSKQNPVAVKSREYLHLMIRDVLRTAASVKLQQPKFEQTMEALSADNPSMKSLQEAWENLESFRTGLRTGACEPLEELMVSVAKKAADKLLKNEETTISSRDLTIILCVFKEFQKQAGALDMHTQLMKWAKVHNDTLAMTETEALLADFIDANSKQTGKRGAYAKMDANRVREMVQQCGGKIPQKLFPMVHACLFLYIKAATDQAGIVNTKTLSVLLTILTNIYIYIYIFFFF